MSYVPGVTLRRTLGVRGTVRPPLVQQSEPHFQNSGFWPHVPDERPSLLPLQRLSRWNFVAFPVPVRQRNL